MDGLYLSWLAVAAMVVDAWGQGSVAVDERSSREHRYVLVEKHRVPDQKFTEAIK